MAIGSKVIVPSKAETPDTSILVNSHLNWNIIGGVGRSWSLEITKSLQICCANENDTVKFPSIGEGRGRA